MTDPDALIQRVDTVLAEYLHQRSSMLHEVGDDLDAMADEARTFILDGGKRLRPTFVYWGWRATRSEADDDAALVTAAASLELLHGCALVHDDVMDASDTRRGRPAAHAAFAAIHREHGWTGAPETFGNAAAILLGDLLLCWADSLYSSAGLGAPARKVYDDMRQLVMAGQYLDVLVQARGGFSVADALRVAKFKTSKYTVEGPLHLGAAAAGSAPEVFTTLTAYGLALGEAFQLRDDVLGTFGDPGRTGKPAGDDLREGKRTLLVALAMEHADSGEAALLHRSLGDRGLPDSGAGEVCDLIVSSGALDQVEQRITRRAAEACAALESPLISAAARVALTQLAADASQRQT